MKARVVDAHQVGLSTMLQQVFWHNHINTIYTRLRGHLSPFFQKLKEKKTNPEDNILQLGFATQLASSPISPESARRVTRLSASLQHGPREAQGVGKCEAAPATPSVSCCQDHRLQGLQAAKHMPCSKEWPILLPLSTILPSSLPGAEDVCQPCSAAQIQETEFFSPKKMQKDSEMERKAALYQVNSLEADWIILLNLPHSFYFFKEISWNHF